MKQIISYLLITYPLQVLALPLASSKFDLFPILLLLAFSCEILLTKKIKRISKLNLKIIIGFFVASITIYLAYRYATFPRFISGIFWLTGLLYVNFTSYSLYSKKFYEILICIGIVVSCCIIFQYVFLNHPRPKASFIEPSTAGLVLYSMGLMMGYRLVLKKKINANRKMEMALFFLFTISGFLTKSSHLFLLIIVPSILLSYVINAKTLFKILIIVPPIFTILFYLVVNDEYFINKFNFSDVDNFNLSQLAWLRGLEQALFVIKHSPLWGFGLGATGCFSYNSEYTYYLERLDGADLNLFDAYSLMFRWIVEIGLFTVIFLIYLLHRRVKTLMDIKDDSEKAINIKSLFVFGFSIMIGSFIKDPNYGVSPLFLSIISMSFLNYRLYDQNQNLVCNTTNKVGNSRLFNDK